MILSLNNPILLSGILSKSGWSLVSGSQQGNGQERTTPPPPTSKWRSNTQLAFTSRVCKPQPDAWVSAQRLSNLLFVSYDKSSPASEETIRTLLRKTKKGPLRPTNTISFRNVGPFLAKWHPGLSKPVRSPFWVPQSPHLSATWFVYLLLRCPVITKTCPSNHPK